MSHRRLGTVYAGSWGEGLPLNRLRKVVTGACVCEAVGSSHFSLGSGSCLAGGQELQLGGLQGAEGLAPSPHSLA